MTADLAKKISSVFHPISYPLVTLLLYFILIPRYFNWSVKLVIISIVILGSVIFPILLLYYLKNIGFIETINMPSPKERKLPLIVIIMIALMMGRVFYNMQITEDISFYFFAGAVSLSLAYFLLWMSIKISLHAMGLGSMIGFVIYLSMYYQLNFLLTISVLFIIFGIVGKARVDLKSHNNFEVLTGLILGVFLQIVIPLVYQKI